MKQERWKGPPVPRGEFEIGKVLVQVSALLGTGFTEFFAIVALCSLPVLIDTVLILPRVKSVTGIETALSVAAEVAAWLLGQSIVTHAGFQLLRGRKFSLMQSLRAGVVRLLPAIVAFLCICAVIALLGMMAAGPVLLLIKYMHVPLGGAQIGQLWTFGRVLMGVAIVVVSVLFWPAIPVSVIERPGALGSIDRAIDLTRGYRWGVFGVGAFLLVAYTAGFLVIGLIISALPAGSVQNNLGPILLFLVNAAFSTLWAATMVAVYYELRVGLEGFPDPRRDEVIAP